MRLAIHRFLADDTGATIIEYGLIAGMISIAAITALQTMGASLRSLYEFVGTVATLAAQP
ncbi:MAG: Flp family type IVb pilin [Rhodospirillales bacterium]|nr:Flp family type IVb pilin [Rhodospirillales bacterium]